MSENQPSEIDTSGVARSPLPPATRDSKMAGASAVSNDVLLAVRSELYNELRSYRDKELQTFLFAFPVIGAGFTSLGTPQTKILLTAFGVVVAVYLAGNHERMTRIKRRIVEIQSALNVGHLLAGLAMGEWAEKPFYRHLGTASYMLLLLAETAALWFV